ncbi:hypothetical protein ACXR2T_07810 [Leucobacter sp. HY1910]
MSKLPPRNYPLKGLPNPDECRRFLSVMRQGQAATSIDIPQAPEAGFVYLLPLFIPGTNIAYVWDVPVVGVLDISDTVTAHWTAHDRTFDGGVRTGTETIRLSSDRSRCIVYSTSARLHRAVARIVRAGDEARWHLADIWRPYVHVLLKIASANVGLEINVCRTDSERAGVIDHGEIEQLSDQYLLGSQQQDSLFQRLIVRASSDLRAGVGDRVAYIARGAQTAAEDAVRRRIGDPHTGRLIRRVWATLPADATFEDLREEFARRYPRQSGLGAERVYRALTAGQSADQASLDFGDIEALLDSSDEDGVAL